MTVAVCLKCGQHKHGALTRCLACDFEPRSAEEQAKSLMLSDRMQSAEALAVAARRLSRGEALTFDPTALANLMRLTETPSTVPLGCHVAVWLLLATLVGLAGLVVWLWRQP